VRTGGPVKSEEDPLDPTPAREMRETLTGDPSGRGGCPGVARTLINWVRVGARLPGASLRPVEVNGGPGAILLDADQRLIGVWALDVGGAQITAINSIVNPTSWAPRTGRRH
jgi:hypothetical protein